jgi:hypothetical protein
MQILKYLIYIVLCFLSFGCCKKDLDPLNTLSMVIDGKELLVATKITFLKGLEPWNTPPFGDGPYKIAFSADFTNDNYLFTLTINNVTFSEDYSQFYINMDKNKNKSALGLAYCKMFYNQEKKLLKCTFSGKAVAYDTQKEIIIEDGSFTLNLN